MELLTTDLERAGRFYSSLLGWSTARGQIDPRYLECSTAAGAVAGILEKVPDDEPMADVWTVYLRTTNLEQSLLAAENAGAEVVVPATVSGDLGRLAGVIGPAGAYVGLWEPGTFEGTEGIGTPGSLAWGELWTRAFDAAMTFYDQAFDWPVVLHEDGTHRPRYATHGAGHDAAVGILDAADLLGPHDPSHWVVYFAVSDLDASRARVSELGGTVIGEPIDTMVGRAAVCRDDQGASFRLAEYA